MLQVYLGRKFFSLLDLVLRLNTAKAAAIGEKALGTIGLFFLTTSQLKC